ncbi:MAG TPA: hypothetical protein VME92_21745 [Acetobacteraceae bacterium]|nr:hypothetical protein [Acetobacteraceae bacterium]
MIPIESESVSLVFNPEGGHLDDVVFRAGGQALRPMHRAPWRGGPGRAPEALPSDTPTILRSLAGDFFCAPFTNDPADGPAHGETANGLWDEAGRETLAEGGLCARFTLRPLVSGARVRKEFVLRAGHPVLYQRHVFEGGEGALPVAHHAMIHVPGGAALSFSPKAFGATPPTPLEPDPSAGRSILAYPQRFADLAALRLAADGGTVDATHYPFARDHEDLVALCEPADAVIGWAAALAAADGFLFFALKPAAVLPQTVLWMSNGGRDYSPFSGRHRAVLGIEETRAYFHLGSAASAAPNPFSDAGLATTLALAPGRVCDIRYAFGAVPAPEGWSRVAAIDVGPAALTLRDVGGATLGVPFDAGWLAAPAMTG